MPRKPDPETKEQQVYYRGKTEEEKKEIKAAKEIVARNSKLQMRTILKEAIKRFLREHHWPPGNSQTILGVFGAVATKECYLCHHKFPELVKVEFISGMQKEICVGCLRKDEKGRRLVRRTLL